MIKKLKKYSLFAFCAMIAGGYILSVQAPSSHIKPAIHSIAAEVHGPDSNNGDDGSGDNNNNGNNNGNNENNNGSGDNSGSGASSPNPGGSDSTIITGDDTPL